MALIKSYNVEVSRTCIDVQRLTMTVRATSKLAAKQITKDRLAAMSDEAFDDLWDGVTPEPVDTKAPRITDVQERT